MLQISKDLKNKLISGIKKLLELYRIISPGHPEGNGSSFAGIDNVRVGKK